MKYDYARISTDDQKKDLQIAALKKADCRHIFTDTASGANNNQWLFSLEYADSASSISDRIANSV
jgi:predicted site-specific integrase-resolvase